MEKNVSYTSSIFYIFLIKNTHTHCKMEQEEILKTKEKKDLRVVIQDTLSPEQHINQIFGSTYRTLTNIRVAFHYMDKGIMKNSN